MNLDSLIYRQNLCKFIRSAPLFLDIISLDPDHGPPADDHDIVYLNRTLVCLLPQCSLFGRGRTH